MPRPWCDVIVSRAQVSHDNDDDSQLPRDSPGLDNTESKGLTIDNWIRRLHHVVDSLSAHANRAVKMQNVFDASIWRNLQRLVESFMIRHARKEWVDVATLSLEAKFVDASQTVDNYACIFLKGAVMTEPIYDCIYELVSVSV